MPRSEKRICQIWITVDPNDDLPRGVLIESPDANAFLIGAIKALLEIEGAATPIDGGPLTPEKLKKAYPT